MGEDVEDCEHPSTSESQDRSQSPEIKEYSCDRCGKSFTTKKYLRSHLKTIHESPRLFICPLCGKQLAREKGLNQHIRTIHEGNWSVFCSLCGKGFINRCRLKKHCTNVHERSSRFPCPICDKGFTSDAYRIHHMELVHHDHEDFKCEPGLERTNPTRAPVDHMFYEHTGSRDNREALTSRELSFLRSSSMIPSNPYESKAAENMDASSNQPSSSDDQPLDLSIRKYRPPTPERIPPLPSCFLTSDPKTMQHSFPEVSSTSRGPGTDNNDLKLMDEDDLIQGKEAKCCRYNCTYCGKTFASKEYLRLHEATVHEGTKAFVCSVCGKHFSVHQAMRKHYIVQHEGGKPYRCRDCKMEFRTRASLRSHRSTAHTASAGTVVT